MKRAGFTFIDLILTLGITVALFGGIYLVYFTILDVVNNSSLRTIGVSVLNRRLEIIRNLPYRDVGTVGGLPSGVIQEEEEIAWANVNFTIKTTVRNIDDPFDGTLGGVPNDTAPADYKLVELEASCNLCSGFVPILITTTVAPKGLEGDSGNGSLFINVFDANGLPLQDIDVRVSNASVTPAIDLFDTTNASGVLQLVDIPTSTLSYSINVGKSGYSSDKTYPPGGVANPNPIKAHATVVEKTATSLSFAIDKTSTVNVKTLDVVCAPFADKDFSMSGSKLIGTNPDTLKFSTSSATEANGVKTFANVEWDAYEMILSDSFDIVGTIPLAPLIVNPSTTVNFSFILQPEDPNSLLVTIKDAANGGPIFGTSVNLSKAGFSETLTSGHNFLNHSNWSGGAYITQSGGLDADIVPGSIRLLGPAPYSTSTESWLISNTFDVGSSTSAFYKLNWSPTSQPPQTGGGSLRFQVASNNDDASWDFIGPDGTVNTYYTSSGSALTSGHNNHRYLRYKVFMSTQDENTTPQLDDVSIEFNSICVPPSQVLFTNLGTGTYDLDVTASGYTESTSSVSISGAWQQEEILLTPQ